jgi:hypothetical protein
MNRRPHSSTVQQFNSSTVQQFIGKLRIEAFRKSSTERFITPHKAGIMAQAWTDLFVES